MDVKATLLPGANGTKTLLREYGDQLVCVRYRYDNKKHKRYKTIEIIVEEKDWIPAAISYPEKRVFVRIGYGEAELRELIKHNGGYWNPDKKAWHLSYRNVVELGLEKRILDDVANAESDESKPCGIKLAPINKKLAKPGETIQLSGIWGKEQGKKVPAVNDGYLNELMVLKWSNKKITARIPEHFYPGIHKVGGLLCLSSRN